jgi:Sec-independent protein secretion pathway component TatC
MSFGARDPRARFSIVLTSIILLSVVAGYAITTMAYDSRWVLAIPLLALFFAGIAWDRIFLHNEPL